jgi:hypothetical protein
MVAFNDPHEGNKEYLARKSEEVKRKSANAKVQEILGLEGVAV